MITSFLYRECLRTRVWELKVCKQTAPRCAILLWRDEETFLSLPAPLPAMDRLELSDDLRFHASSNEYCVSMHPVFPLYSGVLLERSRAEQILIGIAKTEFVICAIVCFVKRQQIAVLCSFTSQLVLAMSISQNVILSFHEGYGSRSIRRDFCTFVMILRWMCQGRG